MVTKILKNISVFVILLTLTACLSLDPCVTSVKSATVPNLIKILPLQTSYSVGDVIEVSIILPSSNYFFNNEFNDIYQETSINWVELNNAEIYKVIEGNSFIINEGSYSEYIPKLNYYPDENEYRFKVTITLNNIGEYSIWADGLIYFKNDNDVCTTFSLGTNIEGMNENEKIEFTVEQ